MIAAATRTSYVREITNAIMNPVMIYIYYVPNSEVLCIRQSLINLVKRNKPVEWCDVFVICTKDMMSYCEKYGI